MLEACKSPEWRLLVVLARYGGLRVPSDASALRWADVLWDKQRLVVTSPKTEHHDGKESRVIPIFPEIEGELRAVYDAAPEGSTYVLEDFQEWSGTRLRGTFPAIIRRAGLNPWPKLWHNLRATRETELAEEYPVQTVKAWIGNSPDIALKNYLQVTDEHFERAVALRMRCARDAQWGATGSDLRGQTRIALHCARVRSGKWAILDLNNAASRVSWASRPSSRIR